MTSRQATATPRNPARLGVGLLIAGAIMGAAYGWSLMTAESSSSFPPPAAEPEPSVVQGTAGGRVPEAAPGLQPERRTRIGVDDGLVPDGTTVFENGLPGVANLAPDLLDALRRATADAAAEGIVITLDSGWRSHAYQTELFEQAIGEYGSEEEAARWVARPGTSTHESGIAVDIGPSDAAEWLATRGAAYGLCQIYRNEPWHYELRAGAAGGGCPAMYASAADDPRMQP